VDALRPPSSLSPSALTGYLACTHLASLQFGVARGDEAMPLDENAQADLIRTKGEEHEARYLRRLREEGRTVLEIPFDDRDFERAVGVTENAIRVAEHDVIYQACLASDEWRGFADFLERTPGGTYEAVDTKLARTAKPAAVLQLCFYTQELDRIQGSEPELMHVVLGTGERESFRPSEFAAYFRRVRDRFARFAAELPGTYPYRCEHCPICDFKERCAVQWEDDDHLVRVARIRRDQIERLGAVGIKTLTALGVTPAHTPVPRMAPSTFETLRDQAELQLGHITPPWHLLPPEPERGFGLLPATSVGDLFFDMEGDPFFEPEGGLEYLFGVWSKSGGYEAIWAHDRVTEQEAFEQLVDLIHERLRADPGLHVYHYAAYETAALKRLAAEYATREEEVDELLRREIFVDLYAVVRQALRAGVPSYSIKDLEALYGFVRHAELRAGDDSIILFNQWLDSRDEAILSQIADYNAEDCVSTHALREWLLALREDLPWREPPNVRIQTEETAELRTKREELCGALLELNEGLTAQLLQYHRREAKPGYWWFFSRLERTSSELVDDSESIGELAHHGAAEPAGPRSTGYWFTFPPQQHRLDEGDGVIDPVTGKGAGTIDELDNAIGRLRLSRGNYRAHEPLPTALIPQSPYDTSCQQQALLRFGHSLLARDRRYGALEQVLRRELPLGGAQVQRAELEEQQLLAEDLEGSYLFVQGPAGSGKTYRGARLIAHLLERGKRVGVASTSHKAIHNLLDEVERAGLAVKGLKKCSERNPESIYTSAHIESETAIQPFLDPKMRLLAGTAWLFAREELDQQLDYLVIDEAGQVSLADALAMGTSARSLILLGDPMQLAQVREGTHPEGSGASVLEHLLNRHITVPEDRGLFLEHTRRMHPAVCGFVSETFYEGRLESDAICSDRTTPFGTGLRYLPVEHSANRQSAPEEAAIVRDEVARLISAGVPEEEILVVAAYNAQVRCLQDHLPAGARIGTVDKFQGQEADVVFFSMASSSGEDIPRGLEFLFSPNRLNVAISRARCLAYVVGNPRLLEINCRSIAQMRLANALCRFVELATPAT
jgi:predicted RecB family nuclease